MKACWQSLAVIEKVEVFHNWIIYIFVERVNALPMTFLQELLDWQNRREQNKPTIYSVLWPEAEHENVELRSSLREGTNVRSRKSRIW